MIETVFVCLGISLTVPGFVTAIRALPFVATRVAEGRKPWACNICMSFWSTALITSIAAAVAFDWRLLFLAGPSYTLALVLLERVVEAPPALPPDLPEA